jgi:biopolymer transport protein ExbD
MSRFRPTENREVPGLNLAAMPDLIFTVLFFFMIVTHMRDVKPKVQYQIPQGSEIEKAHQSGLVYLFIGKRVDQQGNVTSDETCIQVNKRIVALSQLGDAVKRERDRMPEDVRQHMVVSIRADRNTEMGIINDIKQELRKVGALNINYSATFSRNPQKHN